MTLRLFQIPVAADVSRRKSIPFSKWQSAIGNRQLAIGLARALAVLTVLTALSARAATWGEVPPPSPLIKPAPRAISPTGVGTPVTHAEPLPATNQVSPTFNPPATNPAPFVAPEAPAPAPTGSSVASANRRAGESAIQPVPTSPLSTSNTFPAAIPTATGSPAPAVPAPVPVPVPVPTVKNGEGTNQSGGKPVTAPAPTMATRAVALPATPPGATNTFRAQTQDKTVFTFRAENLELKTALAAFARLNELNIIPDQEVDSLITLELSNLPLEQMMRALLEANGCVWTEEAGLIRVRMAPDQRSGRSGQRSQRRGRGTHRGVGRRKSQSRAGWAGKPETTPPQPERL